MRRNLERLLKFIQVTPVQQSTSIFCLASSAFAGYIYTQNANTDTTLAAYAALIALTDLTLIPFVYRSAFRKMDEYDDVKLTLQRTDWDKRVIESKSHSWCQRHLVQFASDDVGFGEETKKYLKDKGYSWYNFFKK